ncbi:uncharacterized protein MJAP1_001807 [Malassezia japonica]|uniref:Cyclin-like domain-containing protein n=1 Tax=Malassezia japonica TaxID=223818 RepID=A0AAF0F5S4_9BASI|nr:uncharacterized protein MJAP1_001807 [Malassezia japonica]WFD38843.1 hypothetical protein MJAP1_001807 [Malassezia japonica]
MANAAATLPQVETQWLFQKEDLAQTPSVTGVSDGSRRAASPHKVPTLTPTQERVLRGKGVHLIFKMGEFLQLGQHVMTTAVTYFHRFFMRRALQVSRSGQGWSHYEIAAACVFLACKVEEALRKLPAVVDAAMSSLDKSHEGQMRWADRSYRANPTSHECQKWRDCILLHEEALLTTLCFDLVVPQPHEVLVRATQSLEVERPVARLAWCILNDCLRDPTFVLFDAPVVAAGAFKKACALRSIDPAMYYAARPRDAPPVTPEENYLDWLDVFDVDEDEAQAAMTAIDQDVYDFHMPLQHQRAHKGEKSDKELKARGGALDVATPERSAEPPERPAEPAPRKRSGSQSSRESGEISS